MPRLRMRTTGPAVNRNSHITTGAIEDPILTELRQGWKTSNTIEDDLARETRALLVSRGIIVYRLHKEFRMSYYKIAKFLNITLNQTKLQVWEQEGENALAELELGGTNV